jgi:ActR/RegA family two-component response regulator
LAERSPEYTTFLYLGRELHVRPAPSRIRLLFVDDEPSIRVTLPAILERQGFEVTAAESVSAALREINQREFDVLISDLNIGEAGDGFTVVSAMRRTQPQCINFILTGYPAFESALQAIRNQVDDYLVKPANIEELVDRLRDRLSSPKEVRYVASQPLANFLREHADKVLKRALADMKSHPRLGAIPLSDIERVDHVPGILAEVVRQLESADAGDPSDELLRAGVQHGDARRCQGYSQEMLVDDTRIVDSAIYALVQDHLLEIRLSNLIPDLSRLNDVLEAHLQASLKAFSAEKVA